MAGLLSGLDNTPTEDGGLSPLRQALLAAGQMFAQASAQGARAGQGITAGLGAGGQAYQGAIEGKRKAKREKTKDEAEQAAIEQLRAEIEDNARRAESVKALLQGPVDTGAANQGLLGDMTPQERALYMAMPPEKALDAIAGRVKPANLPSGYVRGPDGQMTLDPGYASGQAQLAGAVAKAKQPFAEGEGGGPFQGKAMDAQYLNILLKGDPASPEFAAAYAQMAQPRVSVDPVTQQVRVVSPDMSAFRNPASMPVTSAPAAPQGGAQITSLPGGGAVTVIGDETTRASKQARDKAVVEAAGIANALKDFEAAAGSAGVGEKATSLTGVNTPLNTAFNKAALLAKAETLFNLGVLNGQDLEVLRRILPDPSTWRGAVSGAKGASAATNQVIQFLQDKLNANAQQMGEAPIDIVEYGKKIRGTSAPAGGIKFMGYEDANR